MKGSFMFSRVWLISLVLLLTSPICLFAQGQSPADTVKELYGAYGIGGNSGKTGLDEQLANRLFDPSLARLYRRAGESGGLEADFFVQGQDFSLARPIDITAVITRGNRATVAATLTQNWQTPDRKPTQSIHRFKFLLKKNAVGWQIYEVFCRGDSVTSEWEADIKEATGRK
jgi:hypothetical protein